jgi:hypothetical protein
MTEDNMSADATDMVTLSGDFDILAHKPTQTLVHETIETVYKYITP